MGKSLNMLNLVREEVALENVAKEVEVDDVQEIVQLPYRVFVIMRIIRR